MKGGKLTEIPQEAQQAIMQLQSYQQQLQAIAIQKKTLTVQKMEIDRVLEELKKTDSKEDVYRISGPILIRTTKTNAIEDLTERKDKIETSLKRLEDHERKIVDKSKESQGKIEKMFAPPERKAKAG